MWTVDRGQTRGHAAIEMWFERAKKVLCTDADMAAPEMAWISLLARVFTRLML
jgi:hypothetical protein